MALYNELTLYKEPDKIYVVGNGAPKALSINRTTFEVSASPCPTGLTTGQSIEGVVGIISLPLTQYLIVITEKVDLGSIDGVSSIWKMTKFELVPFHESRNATADLVQLNNKYLDLLHKTLSLPTFFFSYTYDVSLSVQAAHDQRQSDHHKAMSAIERTDERFVWNKYLLKDLECDRDLHGYCLPIAYGVLSITTCSLNGKTFEYVLVSRRNWHRMGVRYFVRGADDTGDVANFVETEQIVRCDGNIASHVNTRGSIPLYWSQRSDITYKPYITFHSQNKQKEVFMKHMERQVALYGPNTMVSLIDDKGKEKDICRSLTYIAGQKSYEGIRYIHFDFHKECGKNKWYNLAKLMKEIEVDIDGNGYFFRDNRGEVQSRQSGVVRTNCIDCLDRTNVVQGLIAKRVLTHQFQRLGILPPGQEIHQTSQFEFIFKNRWADNGDGIALQYTGTPALKSDFTRTGVRTKKGLLHDGVKSMKRYVQNNFLDGGKQDGYDLLLGVYRYNPGELSPLALQKHPIAVFLPTLMAICFALFILKLVMPSDTWTAQLSHLAVYLTSIYVLWKLCIRNGEHLVDQPRLFQTLALAKRQ